MTQLSIYLETEPQQPTLVTRDVAAIVAHLRQVGIGFERWQADQALDSHADNASILAAYRSEIERLVAEHGFQSYDVVNMHPEHPQKLELRQKFLDEHTHSEDEVRFFVRGQGLFCIHIDAQVFALWCEKDDLICVPAYTRHWFDMGQNPAFTAIRLFNHPDGWVANFTGDKIAKMFPLLEN